MPDNLDGPQILYPEEERATSRPPAETSPRRKRGEARKFHIGLREDGVHHDGFVGVWSPRVRAVSQRGQGAGPAARSGHGPVPERLCELEGATTYVGFV